MSKSDSRQKYIELTKNISGFDNSRIATPTTIIGNQTNVGYSGESLTGQKLINMIEAEIGRGYEYEQITEYCRNFFSIFMAKAKKVYNSNKSDLELQNTYFQIMNCDFLKLEVN